MLIPPHLPVDMAWENARHGVPCQGPFAAEPASLEHATAWALAIPWALRLVGPLFGEPVLLLPPTLPGLAALVRPWFAVPVLCAEEPRDELPAVGPDPGPDDAGSFTAAFLLDPAGPPPTPDALDRAAAWVRPKGRLALAWSVVAGERLRLHAAWRPVAGVPAVLPGAPGFDPGAHAAALAHAWTRDGAAVAVLVCERAS